MSKSHFMNAEIKGILTVLPERYISIDDEISFFNNDIKQLNRAKNIVGFGKRYIAEKNTTVVDLGVYAAKCLIEKLQINKQKIDLLIFVNQKPDFEAPTDASIAHGLLDLSDECATINLNHGCSGYVQGLNIAFSFIQSGSCKNCLLIAGDIPARDSDITDRVGAPVFGDAASATLISYTPKQIDSFFIMGSRGKFWKSIVYPIGGRRIPYTKNNIDKEYVLSNGFKYKSGGRILNGLQVFNFTMDVAPKLINELLEYSNLHQIDIDLFAIHQANKQIVDNITIKAKLPKEKTPNDVFSLYGNNSTTSIATVLSEHLNNNIKLSLLCSFGIGLSWAGAIVNLSNTKNLGFITYKQERQNNETMETILNQFII